MRGHTIDLLFVPVIVVPAVLAWIAMATYGYQLYASARWIKHEWPVGYDRATELHDHLTAVTETAS